jgi:hypothetical protein
VLAVSRSLAKLFALALFLGLKFHAPVFLDFLGGSFFRSLNLRSLIFAS